MKKSPTGIGGFDEITEGGLPGGRTTLIEGGAGSGKTVFALQMLVHGARALGEPGIFVAFEENSRRIAANAHSFGWNLPELESERLFFLDAQPHPDLIRSGTFDLGGMLAALQAQVAATGAQRIVFDALDIVLALLDDPAAVRREVFRLHHWLLDNQLTALLTSKILPGPADLPLAPPLGFLQFMVDCSVRLDHDVVEGVSQRSLRVCKYRGSAFMENATPFVIGHAGIEAAFAYGQPSAEAAPVRAERISSGIDSLDQMLGGGYFRGAGILLTGSPGTAKTTLCGVFAEAACRRGDPTLFVSFDSRADEVVHNLESVAIRLQPFVDSGLLKLRSMRALGGSAESYLIRIKQLAHEHGARCLVIDPLSALSKAGNRSTAPGVAERLIDWGKANDMTIMCTSLLNEAGEQTEASRLQISTIADTWIHLNYGMRAGERNRGLSIIKARGTSHSNQVRELILSDAGVTLSEVYTADGEVLMGTLRWAREREDRLLEREREADSAHQRMALRAEAAEIEAQIATLREKLLNKRAEEANAVERTAKRAHETRETRDRIHEQRAGRHAQDD
jgi:circadian clock protein KaiC